MIGQTGQRSIFEMPLFTPTLVHFTHSLTHSPTHPLTHTFIQSHTHKPDGRSNPHVNEDKKEPEGDITSWLSGAARSWLWWYAERSLLRTRALAKKDLAFEGSCAAAYEGGGEARVVKEEVEL